MVNRVTTKLDDGFKKMIHSMTAFARCEEQGEWGALSWEIRSLNHRYLEVFVRLPEELRALENQVRERIGKRLKRGKVEVGLRYKAAVSTDIRIDTAFAAWSAVARRIPEGLHTTD